MGFRGCRQEKKVYGLLCSFRHGTVSTKSSPQTTNEKGVLESLGKEAGPSEGEHGDLLRAQTDPHEHFGSWATSGS